MIDLHAHTNASDGSLSPRELVMLARDKNLRALGITDHDTIGGWDEASAAGSELGVEIVPGVELSVAYERGRFHLLGYYVNANSPLIHTLQRIQAARANRNEIILENLRNLGLPLEESEVHAFAGENGQIGRPHFARAMVARGYVQSVQEAFDEFLADNAKAYATKAVLTPREAIEGIHEAGGVAIWAHPPRTKSLSLDELEDRVREWKEWGLDGLEIYYSQYEPHEADWALQMTQKYNLLGTGGSDYHGASKPTIQLGVTHTGRAVPDEVLDALKARTKVL